MYAAPRTPRALPPRPGPVWNLFMCARRGRRFIIFHRAVNPAAAPGHLGRARNFSLLASLFRHRAFRPVLAVFASTRWAIVHFPLLSTTIWPLSDLLPSGRGLDTRRRSKPVSARIADCCASRRCPGFCVSAAFDGWTSSRSCAIRSALNLSRRRSGGNLCVRRRVFVGASAAAFRQAHDVHGLAPCRHSSRVRFPLTSDVTF